MKTDKELDFLESYIPKLAKNATQKAYLDALSGGSSVLEVIDGKIYKTFPDGTRTFVKKTGERVRVGKNVR